MSAALQTGVKRARDDASPMATVIKFYGAKNQYGELTNFRELTAPIVHDGISYPTSEHLYQAMRFIYDGAPPVNAEIVRAIAAQSTPYKAKLLAQLRTGGRFPWQMELGKVAAEFVAKGVVTNSAWADVKIDAMHTTLRLKFAACAHCRDVLLSTGDALLEENTPRDKFWANAGRNELGKLLVKVRDELRSNA